MSIATKQGTFVAGLWFFSPIILAVCKLLEIAPVTTWPWFYVTAPWWVLFLWQVFATMVAAKVVEKIKKEANKEHKF